MLAKSPSSSTDFEHLLDEIADEAIPAFESALRKAFASGWQAHAAAMDEAAAKLRGLPSNEHAGALPFQDIDHSDAEASGLIVYEAPSEIPTPNSQPAIILNIITTHPNGITSLEVIEAVHKVDSSISIPSIRTTLYRLKLRRLIYSRMGKWFPARAGNAGGDTPARP